MNRVFFQVKKVKQSVNCLNKTSGCTMASIWNLDVNKKTKKEPADLIMLCAGDTTEMGYALEK
jgi:hypothetical protein